MLGVFVCIDYFLLVHFKSFFYYHDDARQNEKCQQMPCVFIMQLLHLWASNKSMLETESRFFLCIKQFERFFDRPSNKNKFIYLSRSACSSSSYSFSHYSPPSCSFSVSSLHYGDSLFIQFIRFKTFNGLYSKVK